jgi:O-antigen/teichoic acid export membrane protein
MSVAKKAFKGSIFITGGEAVNQLCSMLRNVVLARALTRTDFGVAAMLGMGISVFEIGGRLSIEQLIVQSKEAEQPHFKAVAHLVQVALGVLSAILILIAAHPLTKFFGVPEAAWALQVMAVLPVLRSLANLDTFRMTRELRFGPGVLIDLVPQVVTTLAVWPLTQVLKSYVVLVWIGLTKQTASTVASHFIAERKYAWAFDWKIVKKILTFGWPMLVSGFLMFGIMQGDRFAVGIKYSVAELGVYAVAGSLSLMPAATLLKLSGVILLPLMASVQDNTVLFLRRLRTTSEILALFSGVYAMVMVLAGGPLVTLIFGAKYTDSGALTAWLGLAQAMRLLRGIPTVGAMAKGDSQNLMFSNFLRLSGTALAFLTAMAGGSLAMIASCAAIGESAALTGSFWRFTHNHRVPVATYLPAFSLAVVFIALSAVLAHSGIDAMKPWIPLSVTAALILIFVGLHLAIFKDSRRLLLDRIGHLLPGKFRFAARTA